MFGLELRKKGNINNLYRDVDAVLDRYGIKSGQVTESIQRSTIAHALQKMIQVESFFSICTIKASMDVCQVCIPVERMRIYSAAHCIHWNQMTEEYRAQLIAMILDDFRSVLNPETLPVTQ